MLLKKVFEKVDEVALNETWAGIYVSGICSNSKQAKKLDLFFCLSENEEKAQAICQEAIFAGACVIVSNFDIEFEHALKVKDVRSVFAKVCTNFYGRACDEMTMICITVTNGKTTT